MKADKRGFGSGGQVVAGVVVFLLWVATAVLGFMSIIVAREIVLNMMARFGFTRGHELANWLVLIPMGILFIGVVIGGAEYHFRRIGQAQSWHLFARTLAAELSILALGLFI